MYSYPVLFTPERTGFVVTVPDIPEVVTEGDSIEEATENAIDAIEQAFRALNKRLELSVQDAA